MTKIALTRPFLDDLSHLNPRTEAAVWEKLQLVEAFPGVGSAITERMLVLAFGGTCLKVNVNGYDIIYERHGDANDCEEEIVVVLGIIAQRAIR